MRVEELRMVGKEKEPTTFFSLNLCFESPIYKLQQYQPLKSHLVTVTYGQNVCYI